MRDLNLLASEFIIFIANEGVTKDIYAELNEKRVSLRHYLDNTAPELYIDGLGLWEDMPGGHRFWKDLENRWFYIVNSKKEASKIKHLKSIW